MTLAIALLPAGSLAVLGKEALPHVNDPPVHLVARVRLLGRVHCLGTQYFKKIPTITQDLSRRSIATSGESVSMYPRRPKAEAFYNAVDVVVRLHDPTDPSTERTAPPCSAHVQLNDVPRTLGPVEGRGRVPSARRRGGGVGDVIRAGLHRSTTTI